jgi:trehalose 6-phosphate phosphatase
MQTGQPSHPIRHPMCPPPKVPVDWGRFRAVLFDLDGVITQSARIHAAAWKETFDDFLARYSKTTGTAFEPFDIHRDYTRHVDGLPRRGGIRAFLKSRGLTLDEGSPDAPATSDTIAGLANQKNAAFHRILERDGISLYQDALVLLRGVEARGCRTGLITSSRNCAAVLAAAGLTGRFDVEVDGVVAARLQLAGKPASDTFLEAARRLGVAPSQAALVEDSIAGIEAASAGGFALVIAVDRAGIAAELRAAGADLVVDDLACLVEGTEETSPELGP